MAVLQSAALHNIGRMTPYNIATTVWALSKLLRTADSIPADQQAAERVRLPAPASTSSTSGSLERTPAAASSQLGLTRPLYPAAAAGYASSDSDAGAFSSCEDLGDGFSSAGLRQPGRSPEAAASHVDASQLMDGLVAVTARCARQFKPAHVGDALWGFGCLRVSPGDGAVSDLLSAAAAAPSMQPASAACALVGLAELKRLSSDEGLPSWMTEHGQTLELLGTAAGAGFAGLRAASTEQARQ